MKRLARNICIGVLILGLACMLGAVIFAMVDLWREGMWYVPVAMIIFIIAMIGATKLN